MSDIKTVYTILSGGNLGRTIRCKPSIIQIQLAAGEVAIQGDYPPTLYKYEQGAPILLSEIEKPFIPAIFKTEKQVLTDLIEQMEEGGFSVAVHVEELTTKNVAKKAIDQAAGRARFRLVSPGTLIAEEYVLAEEEIKVWRAGGSQANAIPLCITDWIDSAGMTAEQAATDLETQAAAFKAVIMHIRNLRLKGKALVNSATDFKAVALSYINQIDSIN